MTNISGCNETVICYSYFQKYKLLESQIEYYCIRAQAFEILFYMILLFSPFLMILFHCCMNCKSQICTDSVLVSHESMQQNINLEINSTENHTVACDFVENTDITTNTSV